MKRNQLTVVGTISALSLSAIFSASVSAASVTSFGVDKNTVNIEVTPDLSQNVISVDSHTATIKTDCSSGYKIYVSMTNGSDQKLHLSGDSENDTVGTNAIGPTTSSIASLSAGSATTLGANAWGVRVGAATATSPFAAVPTYKSISATDQSENPNPLIVSSTPATTDTSYTISYGANVSNGIYAGSYSNNILYTAVMDQACYEVTPVTYSVSVSKASDATSQAAFSAVSGADDYASGAEVTLGYTLNTGYHFDSWTVKDSSDNSITVSNNKFTMPSSNVTAVAAGSLNTTTINYNAGSADSGTPSKTTETATYGTNVTMPEVGTMAKDGYTFAGWSLSNTATTATWTSAQANVDPTTIKTDLGSTDGGSVTVYAVWEEQAVVGNTMQTFKCSSLPNENDEMELTDSRDGKTYTVKRLKNDTCWMINNLALEDYTLTSADSDMPDGVSYTIPAASDDWVYIPPETAGQYPAKSIGGDAYAQVPKVYHDPDFDKYLYNYVSTSAGSVIDAPENASSVYVVPQSICPKGWRLPTTWDFGAMYNEGIYDSRYHFEADSWSYGGGYKAVDYWSSETTYKMGYYLLMTFSHPEYDGSMYPDEVYPPTQATGSGYGMSVRCIAKDDLDWTLSDLNGNYMQNLTPEIVARTAVGESATLTDIRFGKTYIVKKLTDGKIWMTQNLALITPEWYYSIEGFYSNMPGGMSSQAEPTTGWGTGTDGNSEYDYKTYDTGNAQYGAIYNYVGATGGATWYGSDNPAEGDICPRGWKLPSQSDWQTLYDTIGSTGIFSATGLNLVPAGTFENGAYGENGGVEGKFWTSTRTEESPTTHAQTVSITNGNQIQIGVSQNKSYGAAMRCVSHNE